MSCFGQADRVKDFYSCGDIVGKRSVCSDREVSSSENVRGCDAIDSDH